MPAWQHLPRRGCNSCVCELCRVTRDLQISTCKPYMQLAHSRLAFPDGQSTSKASFENVFVHRNNQASHPNFLASKSYDRHCRLSLF
ncbi:hypothetical protein HaLaN_21890 [Haematococcus lacustris]|uniref:Uncharacterized protein n=1 Tax=Haematococcus lacustris TaxID=44745 RepID=A0A699ZQC6_HAELA|nr:hypothetical protein HaLaN_21890 [Haematococcus lacustris]